MLIGRILFVVLFVGSGFGHLTQAKTMAQYATAKGVPAASLAVPLSGVLILVGAVMVGVGIWPDFGALLLVIFLLPTAVLMHGFWAETDPMTKMNEQTAFLKDISLAGAALVMFALFSTLGDELGLVVAGPIF